jgi:hypothetical protein
VFSRSSSQDVNTRAAALALQAKAQAIRAQQLALQAKEQLTPLAQSAQQSASQGVYQARTWVAPRVEQAGVAVQERIAPAVSAAMITTARRVQPVQVRSRGRWPAILAGVVTVSAAAVAAILLRGQRANKFSADPADDAAPPPAPPASDQAGSNERSETAQADVNGQVRTP